MRSTSFNAGHDSINNPINQHFKDILAYLYLKQYVHPQMLYKISPRTRMDYEVSDQERLLNALQPRHQGQHSDQGGDYIGQDRTGNILRDKGNET